MAKIDDLLAGANLDYYAGLATTTPSKAENLQKRKDAKVEKLGGPSIDISGLYDADSIKIANPYTSTADANFGQVVNTARLVGPNGEGIDAPELKVDGQLNQAGINARIQADNYMMGVDAPNFAPGEGLDPKYYDQYKAAMDPALIERNKQQAFLAQPTGMQGYYGRDLYTGQSKELNTDLASYLADKGQVAFKDYSGIAPVESPRYGTSILPAPKEEVAVDSGQKFLETIKKRESEGRGGYKAENSGHYIGAYQFGAARLADLGLVKAGTKNKDLSNPAVWTGKYGMNSKDAFLNSPDVQEQVAVEHFNDLQKRLAPTATSAGDLYGKMAAAHLLGVNGSKDLNAADGNGTKGIEYYNLGKSVIGNDGVVTKSEPKKYGTYTAEAGVLDRGVNTGKALLSGVLSGAYDVADMVAELADSGQAQVTGKLQGWDLGTDEQKTQNVDSLVGYDRQYSQKASEQVKTQIVDMVNNGVTVEKVWDTFKTGISTPEHLGESLGYLATLLVGGPISVGGKGVVAANVALKAAKATGDAAKIAKSTAVLKEAKAAYSAVKQSLDLVSKNIGLLSVSGGTTNDDLDMYAKAAGIGKGDVDGLKVAGTFAGNVVLNLLDRVTDVGILKGPEFKDGLVAAAKGMTKLQLSALGKGLAKVAGSAAYGGSKEASTEYAQTFIEQVNQQVGEQAGKTIADAWNSGENALERLTAGTLGFTGAQQMNLVTPVTATREQLGAELLRRKQLKEQAKVEVDETSNISTTANTLAPTTSGKVNETITDVYQRVVSNPNSLTAEDFQTLIREEEAINNSPESEDKRQGLNNVQALKQIVVQQLEQMSDDEVKGLTLGSKQTTMRIVDSALEASPERRDIALNRLVDVGAIDIRFAEDMKKSASQVEFEATDGTAGYNTYGRMLQELNKNPEENKQLISKYQDKVNVFLNSQQKYVDMMEEAVTEAESQANALNNPNFVSNKIKVVKQNKNGQPVVVEYAVPDLKQSNGKPVVIVMNRVGSDTGNFQVSKGTSELINVKKRNIRELTNILDSSEAEIVTREDTATTVSTDDIVSPITKSVPSVDKIRIKVLKLLDTVKGDVVGTKKAFEKALQKKVDAGQYTPEMYQQYMVEVNDILDSTPPLVEPDASIVIEDNVVERSIPKAETLSTVDTKAFEHNGTKHVVSFYSKGAKELNGALARNTVDGIKMQKGLTKQEILDYITGKSNTKMSTQKKVVTEVMKKRGIDLEALLNSVNKSQLRSFILWHEIGHKENKDTKESYYADKNQTLANSVQLSDATNSFLADSAIEAEIASNLFALNKVLKKGIVVGSPKELSAKELKHEQVQQEAKVNKLVQERKTASNERVAEIEDELLALELELNSTDEALGNVKDSNKLDSLEGIAQTNEIIVNGASIKHEDAKAIKVFEASSKGRLRLNTLSPVVKKQVTKLANEIKAVLNEKVLYQYTGYNALVFEKDSPFRLLLGNDRAGSKKRVGSVVTNSIAEVMAIAVMDFVVTELSGLQSNDEIDIQKLLGRTGTIPKQVKTLLKNTGKLEQVLATSLGQKVAKGLGIKVKSDQANDLEARLHADIGGTLLRALHTMGILEAQKVLTADFLTSVNNAIDDKKGADLRTLELPAKSTKMLTTYRMRPSYKQKLGNTRQAYKGLLNQVEKELNDERVRKGPRFNKVGVRKVGTKNAEGLTEVSKSTTSAIQKAENTEFTLQQETAQLFVDMWGTNSDMESPTKDQIELMKMFGWRNVGKNTTIHIDKRSDVQADNDTLFRKLSDLTNYVKDYGSVPTYFDYFVSKNGRFFIDSATLNPQTDKIARFILTVKANDSKITSDSMDVFKIGVVQAFDGSSVVKWDVEKDNAVTVDQDGVEVASLGAIDKQSQVANLDQFERILKADLVKAAIGSINTGKPDYKLIMSAVEGVDHPSHAVVALFEMAKYVQNKGKPGFESQLVIETDGVTSGVFLGHLLNPSIADYGKLKEILTRGGMFFEGNNAKSFGEWKEKAGSLDTYQAGIEPIKEAISAMVGYSGIQKLVKVNRAFMKSPIMVFFYGAGKQSIKRAIADNVVENIIDTLSKDDNDFVETKAQVLEILDNEVKLEEAAIAQKQQDPTISDSNLKKFTTGNRINIQNALTAKAWLNNKNAKVIRETSMVTAKSPLKLIVDIVHKHAKEVHGAATVEYMDANYGEVRSVQEAMNAVFAGSFGVFKRHYDKKLVQVLLKADRVPTKMVTTSVSLKGLTEAEVQKQLDSGDIKATKAQVDQVLKELLEEGKVPGILTVDADKGSKTNIAAIAKREKQKAGETSNVQLAVGTTAVARRTVNPLVYEYVANPVAGGVINIHYFDSAMIQKIIKMGTGLGVHDAFVVHVNNAIEAGKTYNQAVWEASQKFDMIGQVMEHFQNAIADNNDKQAFIDEWINEEHLKIRRNAFAKEAEMTDDEYKQWSMIRLENILATAIANIKINKGKLRKENFNLSQMAGPEGIEFRHEAEVDGSSDAEYSERRTDEDILDEVREQASVQVTTNVQNDSEFLFAVSSVYTEIVNKLSVTAEAVKKDKKLSTLIYSRLADEWQVDKNFTDKVVQDIADVVNNAINCK